MDKGKGVIRNTSQQRNQQGTYTKKLEAIYAQANDIAAHWDAEVGIIVFSNTGDMFVYCSETTSLDKIVDRYKSRTGSGILHPMQPSDPQSGGSIHEDLVGLRVGINHIARSLQHYTSVDNWGQMKLNDLDMLERELRFAITEIQVKKDQLLHQELQTLQKREKFLADANRYMYEQIQAYEAGQQQKQQHDHQQDLLHRGLMTSSSNQHEVAQNDVLNQFPFTGEEQPSMVLHLATLQPLFDPGHLHQQQIQNLQIKSEDHQHNYYSSQSLDFHSSFDPPRH